MRVIMRVIICCSCSTLPSTSSSAEAAPCLCLAAVTVSVLSLTHCGGRPEGSPCHLGADISECSVIALAPDPNKRVVLAMYATVSMIT